MSRYLPDIDKKIAQGNTAEVFDFGENRVLKLFREGISSDSIEREYINSKIAATSLTQVPSVFEMSDYEGRLGIVFQKVMGTDMLKLILSKPMKLAFYLKRFASYHSKINIPVSDDMRTVVEKLSDEIGWENDLTDDEKNKVKDRLSKLPQGNFLCHGDFHPGNVIFSSDEAYFIDWMSACKGDLCSDVARTYLLLRFGEPMNVNRLILFFIRVLMYFGSGIYLREYCRLTGVRKDSVEEWMLPVAAARLSEWMTESERKKVIKFVRKHINNL